MKQCKIQSDEGVQLIKISLLRKRLRSELANLSHVSLGQRQVIVQEVQNIISFVDERNNMCMELAARKFYLEGWRQVLETLLATGSLSDLSYTNRRNILTQIVQMPVRRKHPAGSRPLPFRSHGHTCSIAPCLRTGRYQRSCFFGTVLVGGPRLRQVPRWHRTPHASW